MKKRVFALLITLAFLTILMPFSANAYEDAANRITIYTQNDYTSSDWSLRGTKNPTTLKAAGCHLFSYAHAYQWLSGTKADDNLLRELIGVCRNPSDGPDSGKATEDKNHTYCGGVNGTSHTSSTSAYNAWMRSKLGSELVIMNSVDTNSLISDELRLRDFYDNGGVIISNPGGHYVVSVGYRIHEGEMYIQIVDSSRWTTIVTDGKTAYDFSNIGKAAEYSPNKGDRFWVKLSTYRSFRHDNAFSFPPSQNTIDDLYRICVFQEVSSVQSEPIASDHYVAYPVSKGEAVRTIGAIEDEWGTIWYVTADGEYVYGPDVDTYEYTILGTMKGNFITTQSGNSKVAPYSASPTVSSLPNNEPVTVVRFVTNSHGNIWAELTDGSFVFFYDKNAGNTGLEFVSLTTAIKVSSVSAPAEDIDVGSSFPLRGVITAEAPISSVRGAIINRERDAHAITPVYAKPASYTTSLNLNSTVNGTNINNSIKFGSLPTGWYTYKVDVQLGFTYNNRLFHFGSAQTVISSDFTVGNPDGELVLPDEPEIIPVTALSTSYSSSNLQVGNTTTLSVTVSPSNATNKSVTWSTSNAAVATVDSSGKVTAKGPGTATIYAAANDGSGKSASCTVTVTQPVTGISLNTSTLALNTNDTATLTATISPSNASNKTVTWKSSDTTVATVGSNGKVSAKGPGSATITVTAADGSGKKATCTVTVTQLVTGITLNPTSLALDVGTSSTLIATVAPSNASNKAISWSSGNTAVATVDSTGKVTAKAPGTAVITASAQDGSGVYATCSVTVTQPVTSVTLDQHSAAMIVGDAISLTATVKPDNASNKAVTWSSSNSSVAAVDVNGTVTAKNPGSAVITVTAADGSGCSDACTITVKQPVVSISLTPNSATMNVGDTVTVAATISPANASNKAVKWSSSNPSVATVSANGTINAVSWGTATIQCTAEDGYGARAGISIIVSGDVMTNPDMVLPAATTLIEDEAFMGVAATSVKLPDSLVTIGARAFANCKQLTQVYIPRSVTSIHATSFDGTSALVIYGYRNSYAEEYAAQYGYTFVQLDPVQVILPTEITISGSTVLNVNSTAQLQAVVSPDNVTDDTVTWSSSDTSVATVDQNGLVTAISRGYVAITATATADPRVSTSWSMEVKQPVTKITISGTTTVKEGATAQLTATVEPADANCKAVTWTSSNTSVATVNSSGVVTAINAGTTVITATATDGSNTSGKVTITVSPATFSVNFDANGGSCSTSSITATRNAPLGNLPTATCDYYRFDGWYTAKSGGSKVTADTVYSTASNVTLYAHWTINPESGWVLESQVPAGAQITATSWSYTESTESTASTMSGWTPNGSYWRQTGTGSKQYATFPSGYSTSNAYYLSMDKSPYAESNDGSTKREVTNAWTGYIYWHWMYSRVFDASSTNIRISSKPGNWNASGVENGSGYYNYKYFYAMASAVDCPFLSTGYCCGAGLKSYNCSSIINSFASSSDKTSNSSGLGTIRFFRFDYYTSTYTDYEMVYKYYRELDYQTSDPGNGTNITNKTQYVKYREK